jgi:mono/diheme cytochrome c family protein
MTNTKIKLIAIVVFVVAIALLVIFKTTPTSAAAVAADDPAAIYKTKCLACHGPAAAKFYDPAKPEDEQVHAILNGKKGEKPPFMPAFSDKGITEDGAKALVAYMKTLKK